MNRKKIVIASMNRAKINEIKRILANDQVSFVALPEFESIDEVAETGTTFRENAILKAEYYYQIIKYPVIADDSGLVVPVLRGEPGVYSARYAGEPVNYQRNNTKLLDNMTLFNGEERRAFFICYAVFWDGKTRLESEGRVDGYIDSEARGDRGFGYDPVFYYPELGKTFAQLEPAEKDQVSHRYRAFTRLKRKILVYLAN